MNCEMWIVWYVEKYNHHWHKKKKNIIKNDDENNSDKGQKKKRKMTEYKVISSLTNNANTCRLYFIIKCLNSTDVIQW